MYTLSFYPDMKVAFVSLAYVDRPSTYYMVLGYIPISVYLAIVDELVPATCQKIGQERREVFLGTLERFGTLPVETYQGKTEQLGQIPIEEVAYRILRSGIEIPLGYTASTNNEGQVEEQKLGKHSSLGSVFKTRLGKAYRYGYSPVLTYTGEATNGRPGLISKELTFIKTDRCLGSLENEQKMGLLNIIRRIMTDHLQIGKLVPTNASEIKGTSGEKSANISSIVSDQTVGDKYKMTYEPLPLIHVVLSDLQSILPVMTEQLTMSLDWPRNRKTYVRELDEVGIRPTPIGINMKQDYTGQRPDQQPGLSLVPLVSGVKRQYSGMSAKKFVFFKRLRDITFPAPSTPANGRFRDLIINIETQLRSNRKNMEKIVGQSTGFKPLRFLTILAQMPTIERQMRYGGILKKSEEGERKLSIGLQLGVGEVLRKVKWLADPYLCVIPQMVKNRKPLVIEKTIAVLRKFQHDSKVRNSVWAVWKMPKDAFNLDKFVANILSDFIYFTMNTKYGHVHESPEAGVSNTTAGTALEDRKLGIKRYKDSQADIRQVLGKKRSKVSSEHIQFVIGGTSKKIVGFFKDFVGNTPIKLGNIFSQEGATKHSSDGIHSTTPKLGTRRDPYGSILNRVSGYFGKNELLVSLVIPVFLGFRDRSGANVSKAFAGIKAGARSMVGKLVSWFNVTRISRPASFGDNLTTAWWDDVWEDLWNLYGKGVDKLQIPDRDYYYAKDAEEMWNPETGEVKVPRSPVNVPIVKVAKCFEHPLPDYAEVGREDINAKKQTIRASVIIDVMLRIRELYRRDSKKYQLMDVQKGLALILDQLREMTELQYADDIEYRRVFQMARWYAEAIILHNSAFWVDRYYDKWISKEREGYIAEEEEMVNDRWYITTNALIYTPYSGATLTLYLTNYIDGYLAFSSMVNDTKAKVKLYIDGVYILQVGTANQVRHWVPMGSHEIKFVFEGPTDSVGYMSGINLEGCYFKRAEMIVKSTDTKMNGLTACDVLLNKFLKYYLDHHFKKIKGGRDNWIRKITRMKVD